MQVLSGSILTGKESYDWLIESIDRSAAGSKINLASAFIKTPIFNEIASRAAGKFGRVLARWQKDDLLTGASDVDLYEAATRCGWDFYVDLKFHGKIYSVDGEGILLGSANATRSGFSVGGNGNRELCTVVPLTDNSQKIIDQLYEDAVRVDDKLYQELKEEFLSSRATEKGVFTDWSQSLLEKIQTVPTRGLFVIDFFQSPCRIENLLSNPQDADLLGLSGEFVTRDQVRRKILALRVTSELKSLCAANPEGIWFGTITAHFHNLLLDDPAPYRSDVKVLVANLLSWIGAFLDDMFKIDRPNHSQRISLK
jgi:hypothetical protein